MFKRSNEDTEPCWDGIADQAMTGAGPAGKTAEQRILELLAAIPARVTA